MKLVQSPYADEMLRHPVFRLDARRIRWGHSIANLWRHSRRIFLVVNGIILFFWVLLLAASATGRLNQNDALIYTDTFNILALFMFAAIAIDGILDFMCLQAALRTINGEVIAGRWDLLRLTALHERGIVRAKHAAARLRAWRVTMVIASIRASTILLSLFAIFILPYILLGYNDLADGLVDGFAYDPVNSIVVYITLTITSIVYMIEPFWRMQAMTALGMVLSAYIHNTALGLLAAVGAMFGVWILQAIIVAVLAFGLSMLLSVILAPIVFGAGVGSSIATAFVTLVACVITALTIYGFYVLLQTWSLERVVRRIGRLN